MKTTTILLTSTAVLSLGAQAQVLLTENFSYADGDLTAVSGGQWASHSGTTALAVSGGRAFIDQNDATGGRMDLNRALSQTFDPISDNTTKLYASFTVQFSALPFSSGTATAGSYFAHFKSSAANEFYSRVGANTEGAAGGNFRLALSNESWSNGAGTVEFPQDLALGVSYRVVVSLDLATDQSTLWVDPSTEVSTSVTATDAFSFVAGSITQFAMRQGTTGSNPNIGGPGDLFLDNLTVGLSFADVTPVPEPQPYAFIVSLGLLGLATWQRRIAAKA